jgi:3-dehydroquinate dehydratase-1
MTKTISKTIDVRGRKLGGGTPLICSPLIGRTRKRLLDEAAAVVAKAPDIIEWRVDYFQDIANTSAVVKAARALRGILAGTPLIFTRRSAREGGQRIDLDDSGVVRLYKAIGAEGLADLLDFEMGNSPAHVRKVVETAHRQGIRVILSYHNFKKTPALKTLVGRFVEAERLGADVAKVAVMPKDRFDVLTLLSATAQAEAKARIPLISMSMGPLGAVTRMVGGLFGSSLSFAVGEGSSAPGQLPIAELRKVFRVIGRTGK